MKRFLTVVALLGASVVVAESTRRNESAGA
jgi:hypothetical protein